MHHAGPVPVQLSLQWLCNFMTTLHASQSQTEGFDSVSNDTLFSHNRLIQNNTAIINQKYEIKIMTLTLINVLVVLLLTLQLLCNFMTMLSKAKPRDLSVFQITRNIHITCQYKKWQPLLDIKSMTLTLTTASKVSTFHRCYIKYIIGPMQSNFSYTYLLLKGEHVEKMSDFLFTFCQISK